MAHQGYTLRMIFIPLYKLGFNLVFYFYLSLPILQIILRKKKEGKERKERKKSEKGGRKSGRTFCFYNFYYWNILVTLCS